MNAIKRIPTCLMAVSLGVVGGCDAPGAGGAEDHDTATEDGGVDDSSPPPPNLDGPFPVIPGGHGGHVYRVTNLNDDGEGSLRSCVEDAEDHGARICVFEVSGVIALESDLEIDKPTITIAGQTSPDGIMLRNWSLYIMASDVLVHHLAIRVGDIAPGPDSSVHGALLVVGTPEQEVSRVVVDHCSFSWTMDQTASAWNSWDEVTFSNNIFAQPLNDSFHVNDEGDGFELHGLGPLFGGEEAAPPGRLTMIGNLMAHQAQRNPLTSARSFSIVNNVIYNWGSEGMQIETVGDIPGAGAIVGNHFIAGPDTSATPIKMFWVPAPSGTQIYLEDNFAEGASSDAWDPDVAQIVSGEVNRADVEAAAPPVSLDGIPLETENGAVFERVLAFAGARPAFRDSVDARIVADVRAGTGEIINCVSADGSERCEKNAGGWPTYGSGTRAFEVDDPEGDTDGDGFTNLEEELHRLAALVEGR